MLVTIDFGDLNTSFLNCFISCNSSCNKTTMGCNLQKKSEVFWIQIVVFQIKILICTLNKQQSLWNATKTVQSPAVAHGADTWPHWTWWQVPLISVDKDFPHLTVSTWNSWTSVAMFLYRTNIFITWTIARNYTLCRPDTALIFFLRKWNGWYDLG